MAGIKQALLGAAVAGVVAGTGSAVATAVAYADPSAHESENSAGPTAGAPADSGVAPSRSGSRARTGTAHAPAADDRGARDDGATETVNRGVARTQLESLSRPSRGRSGPALPAAAVAPITPATAVAEPVSGPVRQTVPSAVGITVTAPKPMPAAIAPQPVPVTTTPVSAAVQTPRPAAVPGDVPVMLSPAPAAPAQAPVRAPLLPLLPTLPAVPAAPASAASVSPATGANTRVRAASAVAQAAVLADPPAHVLLIGTDGTNLDKILEYTWDNPNSTGFQQVMEQGITAATSIVGHATVSGPSWSTVLTGVWDNKTGVINNLFTPEPYKKWPTVINMLEAYNPGITTQVVADWKYINDIADAGGFPADTNIYYDRADFNDSFAESDLAVTDKTVALINGTQADTPTFLFSYQIQVDAAGHFDGGGSAEYKQAVINVGENIAEILQAVQASERAGVDWTVIVTTDHGQQQSRGIGHGLQSPNETSSFIVFDEAGDPFGGLQNQSYSNVDITPTIVDLFGAPLRSDFDGVPMTTKTSGIVDPVDLKKSLNNAVSAYGYPNIGTQIALGTRYVFATVPYVIYQATAAVDDFLQGIVDKDIFLISGLAKVTQWIVKFNGDLLVFATQAVAKGVAYLTGAGTIPPTDPPLTTNKDLPISAAVRLT